MKQGFADATAAALLLGCEHPLTTALDDVATTARHIGAVATAGGAGLLASAAGSTFGAAVALAAGCVATGLGLRLLLARGRARNRARDAIATGEQYLPVAVVRRERERLVKPHVREELAGIYEDLARRAEPPRGRAIGHTAIDTAQRVALAHALSGVARLLRGHPLDAPVAARAERLIEDRTSPLYGADIDSLRAALLEIQAGTRDRHQRVTTR
jgi:hypothetical protein